jgi:8-oxo-dGTP pyrophosphatase MutT (NUDIX family)
MKKKKSALKTYFVVTAVIKHKGKILALQKSDDDWNYPGKWSMCSGYVKEFESAEDTVMREIKEETGLDGKLVGKGRLLHIKDPKRKKSWVLMAFLCKVNSDKVKICHENKSFKWIAPKEIYSLDTVPGIVKDLEVLGLIK